MAEKDIKYINRDFTDFRSSLIEFSKNYFPDTYTDFTESSPGMMFIEMASYVGDVLSFYLDNQTQENFIQFARQNENLYSMAYSLGYQPKVTEASIAEVEVFQQVPSTVDGNGTYVPDFRYSLTFQPNTRLSSNFVNGGEFLIEDPIDFSFSSSFDPTAVSVYQTDNNGNPMFYLLKKTRKAISATISSTSYTCGVAEKYKTIELSGTNIIKILDVTDSDGNKWTEVPYLAQDVVFESIKNSNLNDPNLSRDQSLVPYLLKLKKVPKRFVARFKDATTLSLQFGPGISGDNAAEVIPNPNNVGIGLPNTQNKLETAYSPTNFTFTDSYGLAPSNTTLTIRYLTGGGVTSNAPSNTINKIASTSNIKFNNQTLDPELANYVFSQIQVNNPQASSGGKDGDTTEEIRFNSINTFQTQLRTVTQNDYLVRALSLPSEYGSLAKVYAEPEKLSNLLPGEMPSVMNLFVLSYDGKKNLTNASKALKQNLITYLSQYRMINDSIRIRDGYVINIGVNFELITLPNFNSNEVINKCIAALQDYFNIDKWQINQPIILRELYILLDNIEGVQTVKDIEIVNKVGETQGYSKYAYDIPGAVQNNIVYPSLDPSIFEVKYPNSDIKGRIVNF